MKVYLIKKGFGYEVFPSKHYSKKDVISLKDIFHQGSEVKEAELIIKK